MAITTSVNINSRSGPATLFGTPFVCTVAEEGTFADLRTVLLEDEIVQDGDKSVFLLPHGKVVGKSTEAHLKWKTALKVRLRMLLDTPIFVIRPLTSVMLQDGEVDIIRLTHPVRSHRFSLFKKIAERYAVCRSGPRRHDIDRPHVSDPEHCSTTARSRPHAQRAFISGTFRRSFL